MKLTRRAAPSLLAVIFLLHGCAAGSRHTRDATLERTFKAHEAEFEALRTEVEADSRLVTLYRNRLNFGGHLVNLSEQDLASIERAGLPLERWNHYQAQLRQLGLFGLSRGGRGVEFKVDLGSFSNGNSYKGLFWYREDEPRDVRPNLDNYRFSDEDEIVYKTLKGHWYLYIYVSR